MNPVPDQRYLAPSGKGRQRTPTVKVGSLGRVGRLTPATPTHPHCAAPLQFAPSCRMMRAMSDLMRLKQTSGMSMISIIEIIKTTLPAGPEERD